MSLTVFHRLLIYVLRSSADVVFEGVLEVPNWVQLVTVCKII